MKPIVENLQKTAHIHSNSEQSGFNQHTSIHLNATILHIFKNVFSYQVLESEFVFIAIDKNI